jgi:3-phosphoglycerate kinase
MILVNMFASSVVDHVFIGGVMVSMFTSSVVEHVFIGGVMGSMFTIIPPMNT